MKTLFLTERKECDRVPGVAISDYAAVEKKACEGLGEEASRQRYGPAGGGGGRAWHVPGRRGGRRAWVQRVSAVSGDGKSLEGWLRAKGLDHVQRAKKNPQF